MDALKLIINFNQKILKIFYVCMIDVFKFQKKLKILYVCMYDGCLKIDFKLQNNKKYFMYL